MPRNIAAQLALSAISTALAAPVWADDTPRIAVLSAFAPELVALEPLLEDASQTTINGARILTGALEGHDVVLALSGISMVNAAMTTQMLIDRYEVDGILFSGIAGGVDPELRIGDVVVAGRWGQYLDVIMAREGPDGFAIPPWMQSDFAPMGMMFPRNQTVTRSSLDQPETKFWFEADPDMLETARSVAGEIELAACNAEDECLSEPPRIVVGGNGVSGAAFVDNAELRRWAHETFEAQVLDMESAAVAHVAYVNDVPFVAFRSLSDLAGGGEGENEMNTFLSLAAANAATVMTTFLAAWD